MSLTRIFAIIAGGLLSLTACQQEQSSELVFSTAQNGAKKRIPAVVVTCRGTFLAATEHRPNSSDGSLTGIYIARKDKKDLWSYDTTTLAYNPEVWGKYMNPSFTVDEAGAHGPAGRIYLFFLATTVSSGMAMDATPSEIASCYVYSDDDGVSWSDIDRVPESAWDNIPCDWMVPSPANGIQGSDGTLYIPCMGWCNGNWCSGILLKQPGAAWSYSQPSPLPADNESICYEGPDGEVYLNCRTEADGHSRPLYRFDRESWALTQVENPFDPNLICQGTICKAFFRGRDFYLMSFCDPTEYNRRNRVTVWVSPDAISWTSVVRLTGTEGSAGYSAVDYRAGKCGVVWENDPLLEEIGFQDLTPYLRRFRKALE